MVSGPKSWWDLGSDTRLTAVKWSADGSELLLATCRGELMRFDPHKGQITHSSQIEANGSVIDIAYVPSIRGYALLIGDDYTHWYGGGKITPDRVLILDPVSGSESGTYLYELPDYLDTSLSPDGCYQLVKKVDGISPEWGQIRKRGSELNDEWPIDLEGVASTLLVGPDRFFEPSRNSLTWVEPPYKEWNWIMAKSWNQHVEHGDGEAYFDSTGHLISDDIFFVFTEKEWWHGDLVDKAVVVAPKGDLFTAELDQVNWTTKTVHPELIRPVDRPKSWEFGTTFFPELVWSSPSSALQWTFTPQWSPNGEYIAAIIGSSRHIGRIFIGLWRASDGRFVRPIGCHRVGRKGHTVLFGLQQNDRHRAPVSSQRESIHWSPDGKYIASVFHRHVFVWEVESGQLVEEFYNRNAPFLEEGDSSKRLPGWSWIDHDGAICWGPDSRSLALVSACGDVEIYNF